MTTRSALLITTLAFCLTPGPARAQVRSLTVGVDVNCPYGMAA